MSSDDEISPIQEINCESSLEFLRTLESSGDLLKSSDWLFRGHDSSHHTLTATLFREENNSLINSIVGGNSPLDEFTERDHTNGYQILKEVQMLLRFAEACDSAGLVIPGPTVITINDLNSYRDSLVEDLEDQLNYAKRQRDPIERGQPWPDPDHFQLMAIARHAGIPTRLLDWSRTSQIAAYFACEVAVAGKCLEGTMCVWALDRRLCSPIRINEEGTVIVSEVKVLKEGNLKMVAQRGMFTTIATPICGWSKTAVNLPLEKHISEQLSLADIETQKRLKGTLLKITLPTSEAPTVLKFLRDHGISHSTMFPSYGALIKDFQEEWAAERAPLLPGLES